MADSGIDGTRAATLFWTTAESRGWLPLYRWSADGAGSGSLTWERNGVRCEVHDQSPEDDDADSTAVAEHWVEQRTFCWTFSGPPTRRDTLNLDPAPAPSTPPVTGAIGIAPSRRPPR
jgi:hypothetical protein